MDVTLHAGAALDDWASEVRARLSERQIDVPAFSNCHTAEWTWRDASENNADLFASV